MSWLIVEALTVSGKQCWSRVFFKHRERMLSRCLCLVLCSYLTITQAVIIFFILAQNRLSLIYAVEFGAIFMLH